MTTNEDTFSVSEKLDISQIFVPEIPEDIIFPNELNAYLRDQIQYYVHENGRLKKNLSDLEADCAKCNTKITDLERRLVDYEALRGKDELVTSSQVASTKIVELSKKLREKNVQFESMRTKYSKLEKYLYDLNRERENNVTKFVETAERPVNELEEQIKKLNEKLNVVTNKLSETKNANLQLKNDLKLANKWLQQEIGENFENIQSLNTTNGNWRGRSQIICDLQQKNNDLKEKLKTAHEKINSSCTLEQTVVTTKSDSRLSILSKENSDLREKYEILKKKNEALKARCKVLDSEHTLYKSKFGMMKEQADRDQDMISTLTVQMVSLKTGGSDELMQKQRVINKLQNEKRQLLQEIEEYKLAIRNSREKIVEKQVASENDGKSDDSSQSTETHQKEGNNEETESKVEKLLKIIAEQNDRLKMEREAHAKTQSQLVTEKQKAVKAEAIVAKIHLEETSRSSYGSMTSALRPLDSCLKDKLELAEERLKAMKTRLDIEQFERKNDFIEFSDILRRCKNDC
ncbi:unnamed protein product [Phaedon cochleariae]|uniref:Uncharacterized protein n=1 Tax=Phaedon cochleariae TaxID=80249 RepID=A0A9P0DRG3_PHACE|nr:unnamed protein product [Phaedon cochleariae]